MPSKIIQMFKKLLASFALFIILFSIGSNLTASAVDEPTPTETNTQTTDTSTSTKNDNTCGGASKGKSICQLQPSNIDCLFQRGDQSCKQPLFDLVLNFLQAAAPYFATLIIVIGGYEFFSDKNLKGTSALGTIQAGVIGLIIILIAPAITTVVTGSFKANGIDPTEINKLLTTFIDFAINIATFAAVLVIILGAYYYFVEGFGEGKATKAKSLISNGVIGLVAMILARPIVSVIRDIFGVNYTTGYEESRSLKGVKNATFQAKLNLSQGPITDIIKSLITNLLIPFASIATVLFIIFGGYFMLTSAGDDAKYKKGMTFVKSAAVGLIVILLATTIVQLLILFIKPEDFKLNSSTNCAGADAPASCNIKSAPQKQTTNTTGAPVPSNVLAPK